METVVKPLKTSRDGIHYDKASCPHCGKDIYVRYQQTPHARILGVVDSNGVIVSTNSNPDIEAIYNFWNAQQIIVHRNLTSDTAKVIKSALKDYTDTEMIQAIKNYAEIQKGEQYWFKYAWTLRDFLKRGIPKFLDMEVARKNYLKREVQPKTKPIHKCCTNCDYKALTDNTHCPKCGNPLSKDYMAGKYAHLFKR